MISQIKLCLSNISTVTVHIKWCLVFWSWPQSPRNCVNITMAGVGPILNWKLRARLASTVFYGPRFIAQWKSWEVECCRIRSVRDAARVMKMDDLNEWLSDEMLLVPCSDCETFRIPPLMSKRTNRILYDGGGVGEMVCLRPWPEFDLNLLLKFVPRGIVVERRSLAGELSRFCARPAADGWPLLWVSHPL